MKKSQLPDIGKVSPDIFEEIILPRLGKKRKEILVGPQNGVDVGVVDLGNNQVMVTTTDPIFIVPHMAGSDPPGSPSTFWPRMRSLQG